MAPDIPDRRRGAGQQSPVDGQTAAPDGQNAQWVLEEDPGGGEGQVVQPCPQDAEERRPDDEILDALRREALASRLPTGQPGPREERNGDESPIGPQVKAADLQEYRIHVGFPPYEMSERNSLRPGGQPRARMTQGMGGWTAFPVTSMRRATSRPASSRYVTFTRCPGLRSPSEMGVRSFFSTVRSSSAMETSRSRSPFSRVRTTSGRFSWSTAI